MDPIGGSFNLRLCTVLCSLYIATTSALPTSSAIQATTSLQSIITSFPIIYVNGGILSCGVVSGIPWITTTETLRSWYKVPFVSTATIPNGYWTTEPAPGNVVIKSFTFTDPITETEFYIGSNVTELVAETSYSPGTPTATVVSTLFDPLYTFNTIGTSYSPYGTGGVTPTGSVTISIISEAPDRKRGLERLPSPGVSLSNLQFEDKTMIRPRDVIPETDCQWNSLYGQSTPDVTSNSLTDVCSLVESVPYCFVSLQPTAAAHMPTWCSYVIQVLFSIIEIFSQVTPFLFHVNRR